MNIFFARLNFKTSMETSEAAFAAFGQVTSSKIVRERETRQAAPKDLVL